MIGSFGHLKPQGSSALSFHLPNHIALILVVLIKQPFHTAFVRHVSKITIKTTRQFKNDLPDRNRTITTELTIANQ